jgi:hypothetical protein
MLADESIINNKLLISSSSVRPNSNHHLLFNPAFVFLIGFCCRADIYKIPAQQQALNVGCYI